MSEPKIVIYIAGGIVQDVVSTVPLTYVVADEDADGASEEERMEMPSALAKCLHGPYGDDDCPEVFRPCCAWTSLVDRPAVESFIEAVETVAEK